MTNKAHGFTLLEILIALFIFTIVSLLLLQALHQVISAENKTEQEGEKLRDMQMALLMISRDIGNIINRPISHAKGQEESALKGSGQILSFSIANQMSAYTESGVLERVTYELNQGQLLRKVSSFLDGKNLTKEKGRILLTDIAELRFSYLDFDRQFHQSWPFQKAKTPLPCGVQLIITIKKWGTIKQLYVLSPTFMSEANHA